MNWIISKTTRFQFHTRLAEILAPLYSDIDSYNWIISDFDFNGYPDLPDLPINYEADSFILNPKEFKQVIEADRQLIWGVVLAVPIHIEAQLGDLLPTAEGNPLIFKDGNIQHAHAVIEIIAFDSSYTVVKFTDQILSNKFKAYFDEAESLQRFRSKF